MGAFNWQIIKVPCFQVRKLELSIIIIFSMEIDVTQESQSFASRAQYIAFYSICEEQWSLGFNHLIVSILTHEYS